jgi:glycosyltransferase involved in cell wall biosynthesis
MLILLFEPHFNSFSGHYIRYARVLAREAAQRGMQLRIAASQGISSAVRDEMFRCGVEILPVFPPVDYRLNKYRFAQRRNTRRLLDVALAIFREHPTKRVAWLSGMPSLIEAASIFAERVRIPFPFQLIDLSDWQTGVQTAPAYIQRSLARGRRFGMKLYAQTQIVSAIASEECGHPFLPFPPILEFKAMRPRVERSRLTIGLMNMSYSYKNASEALDALAPYKSQLNIVVHTGPFPNFSIDKAGALNARIFFGVLDRETYNKIWQSLDAVILPYKVEKYRRQGSGIFFESLADAIIPIVPDDTSMASIAREAGIGLVYDAANRAALCAAIELLLSQYNKLSKASMDLAPKWRSENSPSRVFELLENAWQL